MSPDVIDVRLPELWLLSPLAVIGAGLLLAQMVGLGLHARGLPRLYGAVVAGLVLGVSGFGLIDAPLLSQFQELSNAAAALVLFDVGRKMDLVWLWQSRRQGASLVAACVLLGGTSVLCLKLLGLSWHEAAFIGAIMIAVNPVIFSSMVSDSRAIGVATFASANMVGLSNLMALLALGAALAWSKSQEAGAIASFGAQLAAQATSLGLGALIAMVCYLAYALATRACRARAAMRPGMLLAALLMDLGLCSVSAASALLSLLLMGLLLRNAEKRDNVFQAQIQTGQDIGYALLFMMAAALVDLTHLLSLPVLTAAVLVFVMRILATRVALVPARAWSGRKKNAIAVSLCSVVSFGSLVVDNSLVGYAGLGVEAAQVMAALLGLNVLLAPGLTWWGLKMAGETHEEVVVDE